MNFQPSRREQLFGVWSGGIYCALLFLGWWIAGFIPPPSPVEGAGQIAEMYQTNTMQIRIGMVIVMFSAMFYMPWTAIQAYFITRINGRVGMLTWCQIMAGSCNVLLTFYPPIWWLSNSFRPERMVEITYFINDAAWLMFVGGLTPLLPAIVTIGIAVFINNKPPIYFPRWVGFFNVWLLVLLLPGQLMFFFKTGPFAWDGLLAFWVPISMFVIWFAIMMVMLIKAIAIDEAATEGNYHE